MIKPDWELYNSILSTTDMTLTKSWADACRVVFSKTYSIVEGSRRKIIGDLEELAVKYKSLEEKYFECQKELDQLKASSRKEPSSEG